MYLIDPGDTTSSRGDEEGFPCRKKTSRDPEIIGYTFLFIQDICDSFIYKCKRTM